MPHPRRNPNPDKCSGFNTVVHQFFPYNIIMRQMGKVDKRDSATEEGEETEVLGCSQAGVVLQVHTGYLLDCFQADGTFRRLFRVEGKVLKRVDGRPGNYTFADSGIIHSTEIANVTVD